MRTSLPDPARQPSHKLRPGLGALATLPALLLAACGGSNDATGVNTLPANLTPVSVTVFSATAPAAGNSAATQDLLTGGLGRTGLAAAAPAYADPAAPTALELRRNAIHSNYRGLVDITVAGGFGTFYGPNVGTDGVATTGEGLIPGREYLAVLDDGSGRKRVPVAVQVPDSFDTAAPCIVLGPSSGSRGLYGAIGTSAEWGLKHGCAVALTDAGKGVGIYDPTDDTVNRVDGPRATRAAAGALSHFAANITDAARAAYNALLPNRLALKQVHSQLNPEKDWGNDTLAAAAYALYVLNVRFGTDGNPAPFTSANTLVIAGSVSNGGAAVLHAAEQDTNSLIDGVVAGEPVTEMPTTAGYGITVGGAAVATYGRTLADFTTFGNVYQPCAALAAPATMTETSVFNYLAFSGQTARATARCAGLAAKGLVTGADTAAQALDALNKLRNFGWTADSDLLHNAHYGLGNGPILSAMYPLSYGRFSVLDNVCNTSFAQVDGTGAPVRANANTLAQSFALANGTSNGTPASVVYNDSVGGARVWNIATSVSTNAQDFGLDNALCQRALVTGVDETGASLTATATSTRPTLAQSQAVRAGIAEVLLNGRLGAKPTLIVAGRNDTLIPLNNNARAYTALNRALESSSTRLGYIEVTNAQHFDGFLSLSGFDNRFVPLHVYFVRAMDAMYANLRSGAALPPSQVVRATPRGGSPGAAPALTAANVPAIATAPAAADRIGFSGSSLNVPQ
ncbi:3-hydroxybutyrate oligomer hydrolase family protein [Xylophilus sp. GOD-11R]|uniref:3-hydroxybutyrate oligomer hydrolase family protein n=1 Tax=Xylophilus sp. GOD-11R TaxID=3089814 RepID=UPI00298D2758|nr:3-hydroxybutyrate oligomer hydrolase family protein [Xylophilus sp. GOD-11R]WPB58908.1 3-hydroxybutyrate oligomer hydrolase family protein [Xylophilus sp. GOD-11R]